MRRTSVTAWAMAALALGLLAAAGVLTVIADSHRTGAAVVVASGLAILAASGVGLLVALRAGGHPIGLLLLAIAVLAASWAFADSYARLAVLADPGSLPGGEWAVLWGDASWPLMFLILTPMVLMFPGRSVPPEGRRILRIAYGTYAFLLVLGFTTPEDFSEPFADVDRALPTLPEAAMFLWPFGLIGLLWTVVASVRLLRARYRASAGVERQQLRWLAYTALLVPVVVAVPVGIQLAGLGEITDTDLYNMAIALVFGLVPASIGLAVLRYGLYEIDRIVSRTVTYVLLTMILAGTYAAIAIGLGAAVGSGSAWTTAGATLAVAAAFGPLRRRVQTAVDRRFQRARYEGLRRIAAFMDAVRSGSAAPEEVETVLAEVLADPAVELRYWLPESEVYVDAAGHNVLETGDDDPRDRTPVVRAGTRLGLVLHGHDDERPPGRVREMVDAAGLAIEIARLQVELRRQLDELQESRARIVAVGDAERHRMERDLHDGAQQRLVTIGLALRHAQHKLGGDNGRVREMLDGAVDELTNAIEELRELAHGLRPSQLDDGLAPALRDLASRCPMPVEVHAEPERYPAEIETAAYFIVSEGMTNAVKHAHATRLVVEAVRRNGSLVVSVSDDGVGGASEADGSGLRNLSDRAGAYGGRLRLKSGKGAGTTIVAELPCG